MNVKISCALWEERKKLGPITHPDVPICLNLGSRLGHGERNGFRKPQNHLISHLDLLQSFHGVAHLDCPHPSLRTFQSNGSLLVVYGLHVGCDLNGLGHNSAGHGPFGRKRNSLSFAYVRRGIRFPDEDGQRINEFDLDDVADLDLIQVLGRFSRAA